MSKTIPKLRFPEFSDELSEKEVGDFAPLQRGFDLPASQTVEGEYPVVFSNGILRFHNHYKVNAPGVVTGRSGTIGRVTYVEDSYWPHNTALWVTDFCNNIPKYVYYFYEQLRLERLAAGSGVPTLNRNDVHQQIAYVPSQEEQQKIATFLSTVDQKIGLLAKKTELFLKYKQGVMQQIFDQKIRFKDDNGNDFPDWEEKCLGAVTTSIRNGLSLDQESEERGGVQVTRIETISDGNINLEKLGFIKTEVDISEYRLKPGDILFSNINSVSHIGKMAYVDQEYDLYHGMNLLNMRLDDRRYNSHFFYFLMGTFPYKKHFQRICNRAVSQASINQSDLKQTKLLVPCLEEQSRIASFLSELEKKINLISEELGKTRTFKVGLLQQMFV